MPQSGSAPSGERLRRKGRHGVVGMVKTVSSMYERFESMREYQNGAIYILFLSFPFLLEKMGIKWRLGAEPLQKLDSFI